MPHQPLPRRSRHPGPRSGAALHVPNKIDRVANFQRGTVASAAQMVARWDLDGFG